jgi:hypothetical protein
MPRPRLHQKDQTPSVVAEGELEKAILVNRMCWWSDTILYTRKTEDDQCSGEDSSNATPSYSSPTDQSRTVGSDTTYQRAELEYKNGGKESPFYLIFVSAWERNRDI